VTAVANSADHHGRYSGQGIVRSITV